MTPCLARRLPRSVPCLCRIPARGGRRRRLRRRARWHARGERRHPRRRRVRLPRARHRPRGPGPTRRRRARRGRGPARIFAELDHHALVAFTLLDELRDVALTYGAADPATRRRLAAEAEAALGRAGGALRPGVSPRLAWLGCLVLDGRWEEALRILRDLPAPGNAYLRREMTATRAVLARHRGDRRAPGQEIRPLFPTDRPPSPATSSTRKGSSSSASRPTSASTRATCRRPEPGWRRTTAGSPGAGASSAAPTGRSPGRATTGRPATSPAPAPPRPRRWRSPPRRTQPLVCLAAHRLLGEIETAAEQPADGRGAPDGRPRPGHRLRRARSSGR